MSFPVEEQQRRDDLLRKAVGNLESRQWTKPTECYWHRRLFMWDTHKPCDIHYWPCNDMAVVVDDCGKLHLIEDAHDWIAEHVVDKAPEYAYLRGYFRNYFNVVDIYEDDLP